MTATISPPPGCQDLLRNDPRLRLNDYCEALKYYLNISERFIDRIIFVDNSDSSLDALIEIEHRANHRKMVEFLTFEKGNDFPVEYGKGYGEMTMLNWVIDNSNIIRKDDIIWKATGRLILSNIDRLIETAPSDYDVYCDLHNSFQLLGLHFFFDPRFYSFTINGYRRYLMKNPDDLKYQNIEHIFFDALKKDSGKNVVPRFEHQPIILGHCAADNGNYFTPLRRLKRHAQELMRFLMPDLWL